MEVCFAGCMEAQMAGKLTQNEDVLGAIESPENIARLTQILECGLQ